MYLHMNNRLFSRNDLVRLIIPLIVDQFLQVAVGLSDSIMVARVGEAAVSGVSLVDTVMLLIINIFTALATGGAVIAGQYLGRKDPKTGCEATAQLFNFTSLFSIFIMILGYLGQNVILYHVFGKIEPEVMKDSRTYLLIVLSSIPMIAMYNAGAAIFRAMVNSNVAVKTSLLMNAINVFGNALLIFGFHRGVEGVAIPTVVSRGVACVVILILLNNQEHELHILHPYPFKIKWNVLKKILYIGIPNGLENSMFQLGKIAVLSLVSGLGTASLAANAVGNNIANFAILPGMSFGFALLTVCAQCVGAGDFAQVKYDGRITEDVAVFALDLLEVDKYGLDQSDRRILRTIIEKFAGGPVGLDTLAAALGADAGTLEDVYEPYLLKNGFLNRTARGRMATQTAYEHLGIAFPE